MKRGARRLVVCRICGHLEWDGDALTDAHRCPLCGANRKAYFDVDDVRHRGALQARPLADGWVIELRRNPMFPNGYDHASYALKHPKGVVLYDAPPTPPHEDALRAVREIGTVVALVISHADFVGCAQLWAEALAVDVWMGDEPPLPGNHVEVRHRVPAAPLVGLLDLDDVKLRPTPGHSPGHVAMTWHEIIFAGDAITLARDSNGAGGTGRICLPQTPPVQDGVRALMALDCSLLCTTQGALPDATPALARLEECAQPCARPWDDEPGGAPLTSAEMARLVGA